MSILVKGMEMPKNCLACDWCAHTIPADNYICYRLNRAVIGVAEEDVNETVNACCPIIPLSPHGRLGDLDALAARFDNGKQIISSHPFPEEFKAIYSQLADEMKNEIGKCPTIIPADWTET